MSERIVRRPTVYSLSAMTALLLFRPGVETKQSPIPTSGEAVCAADSDCDQMKDRMCIHGAHAKTDWCDTKVNCS
jgi:hypothetical protein